jgi:hypothetical protein
MKLLASIATLSAAAAAGLWERLMLAVSESLICVQE